MGHRNGRRGGWTRVGSMLHDRKHFAYFPFHSQTLQSTYRHLFNHSLSPFNVCELYSVGLQLAKIDRVKVHDGTDPIYASFCVFLATHDTGRFFFFFFLHSTSFAPFITRYCWLFLTLFMLRYSFARVHVFLIAIFLTVVHDTLYTKRHNNSRLYNIHYIN